MTSYKLKMFVEWLDEHPFLKFLALWLSAMGLMIWLKK